MPAPRRSRPKESNQSLERGLAVLQVFSAERAELTLADVARMAGTTRATARRILLTLEELGHVRSDGRRFSLTPRVLALGWAYLDALRLPEIALPVMRCLSDSTGESCSLATLDDGEIVYVARVPARKILAIALGVGSRLPAYPTSVGRVLLAALPEARLASALRAAELEPFTPETITDAAALAREISRVRDQGWAIVDGELEPGLRSAAAPVRDGTGDVVAALNVSVAASRVSRDEVEASILPQLLAAARQISNGVAGTGTGTGFTRTGAESA